MMPSVSIVIPSYRDEAGAIAAVQALSRCLLPSGTTLQILVVAQGWPSGVARSLAARVIELPLPVGRAAARNIGAKAADGDLLVFLDADCRPAGSDYLSVLLSAFKDPTVAAAGGPLRAPGNGFWARYQSDADMRRASTSMASWSGLTSANLAVRRDAFAQCRGFDEGYVAYGFEDRDLLLRLSAIGKVTRMADATIVHADRLDLATVADKLFEAGARTSARFASAHPTAYRELGYAAIDARMRPWLRPLALMLGPAAIRGARWLEPLLMHAWMPYPLAKSLARVVSALSFLYGTTRTAAQ